MPRFDWSQLLLPVLVGMLIVGLWYFAVIVIQIPEYQMPLPHSVVMAGYQERAVLISGAFQTLYACLLGFFTSVVGGLILSLFLASSNWAFKGFYPYIIMLKMTPVIVVAPIIILWMGQGLISIVAITFLICFFPIVANTTLGLRSVDRDLVELFEVYGASSRQMMLWLRLPAALPFFTSGLKLSLIHI